MRSLVRALLLAGVISAAETTDAAATTTKTAATATTTDAAATTTKTATTTAAATDDGHAADSHSSWDYATNGADWPSWTGADNECGGANQSPIDLRNDWKVVHPDTDDFQKMYTDQTGDIEVKWNGHTS